MATNQAMSLPQASSTWRKLNQTVVFLEECIFIRPIIYGLFINLLYELYFTIFIETKTIFKAIPVFQQVFIKPSMTPLQPLQSKSLLQKK